MADWDEDSPKLRANLAGALREVRDVAANRNIPSASDALKWQSDTMKGLKAPDAKYVGRFRGTKGLRESAGFDRLTEWVRIHPFANGNGRTARLWANYVLMRYGLPPVVRLRPRPDGGYGAAGAAAMAGDWEPTAAVFRKLLLDELS